jgi:hypothetical protein
MECIGFIQCAQAGSASQFHDASSVEGALRTQGAIMHSRIRIVGGICFGVVAVMCTAIPLLNVKVETMTLVMPPAIEFGPAYGMALYSARAVLGGQTHDLIEMIKENI